MTNEQKMEGIMKELEKGVSFFFNSEHFINYLDVISRFHTYSLNNQILIAMQNPDATYVAGYNSWRDNFKRQVRKGEKGMVIIAPYKKYYYREEKNPDTGEMENVRKEYISFRPVRVFDVSQTEGKELPSPVKMLDGTVENFNRIMEAVTYASPFQVNIMEMAGSANGLCNHATETINIKAGMSEAQTIKTAVHEVAHARVHRIAAGKDRRRKEIEAESIAYCVCSHLGLDTSEYSFGYVAIWAGGKGVSELKDCMETIRRESGNIIEVIDKYIDERNMVLGHTAVPEIEKTAAQALNDSIAELGMNSRVVASRYYGCRRYDDGVRAKVMVQYAGPDREDTLFNEVNEKPVTVNGIRLDINPINEEKSGDADYYYNRVKSWEKEDMTDDTWPMVSVIYSTCDLIPVGDMNIAEAEKRIAAAEDAMKAAGITSVIRIKLAYTYGGEKKSVDDRIFLGEGRRSLAGTVNVSLPETVYLKRHIQLIDTIQNVRDNPLSPGTVWQERYEDMLLEWAEKQRIELNYNVEPEISKPPELKPELGIRQHEEWEMIR